MTSSIDNNGTTSWYNVNGELHRDNDLPAIENANGDKEWFINGLRHREDYLPAIEYVNGFADWYKYDEEYSYNQLCDYYLTITRFGRYCLKKIKMRRLMRLRWIHGELLCMPMKGNFLGGQDYHQMVSYFMSM
jgi:hypothetical protein